MNFMKSFFGKLWKVVRILCIIFIIAWFWFIAKSNDQMAVKVIGTLMGVGFLAGYIAVECLVIGMNQRCPHCKKMFALKKIGKEFVNSEQISVLTEVNRYNNSHEKVGTQEQYINGTRNHYRINYRCKCCGKTAYSTYSIDTKNI